MNLFKLFVLVSFCLVPLTLTAQSLPLAVEVDSRNIPVDKPAHVLERHHLRIQPQLLRQERVAASLLHQHRYRFEAGEIEHRSRDSFTWRGRIVDDSGEAGSATLSIRGNRVRGQVQLNRHSYQVSTDRDGNYWLDRLDPAQKPPAHPPGGPRIPDGADTTPLALQALPAPDESEPPVVDVIVFYTEAAISRYADEADMRLAIRNAVDVNNTALINSEVPGRIRLVATFPTDYEETGDGIDALNFITFSGDIALLRNRYSADLAAIISDDTNVCGVGWLMTRYNQQTPHSMTSANAFCLGGQTFAHELGHNMGLDHDPANAFDPEDLIEIFAYGHFVDGEFRTIMSYPNQCSEPCHREDHFSDPDIILPESSLATGTAERNNAEVLRRTMPVVQNWRQQPVTLAEAAGLPGLEFETGGDGRWVATQDNLVHMDAPALLSAPVMEDELAWLELNLGETDIESLSFTARTTVSEPAGVLRVYADETLLEAFTDLTQQWRVLSVSVPDDTETLRWVWTGSNGADITETGAVALIDISHETHMESSLYGLVTGPDGSPVEQVQASLLDPSGTPRGLAAVSDASGYFEITASHLPAESLDDFDLELSGSGVIELQTSLAQLNCEDESAPCEIQVDGQPRTINGSVTGLEQGHTVTISAGHGAEDDFQATNDDQALDFALAANALLTYGPLQVNAQGYSVTSEPVTQIAVRENDAILPDIHLQHQPPDSESGSGSSSNSGFGCSLGNPERKDPVFVLLLMLAFAGMMQRRRARHAQRAAAHNKT